MKISKTITGLALGAVAVATMAFTYSSSKTTVSESTDKVGDNFVPKDPKTDNLLTSENSILLVIFYRKTMKNLHFLLLLFTREIAAKPYELFKSSCDECSAQHDCQDVAVELYRNLAPYRGQRHVPQLIEMFFESERRFNS